jgi:hypothetical protein
MPKVRVAGFGVSLDGFSAGTEQSIDNPLGKRGPEIFQWFFHTKTFHAMHSQDGGSTDIDDEFAFFVRWTISVRSFSVVTCSVPCAGLGMTTPGRVGGAIIRTIILQHLS